MIQIKYLPDLCENLDFRRKPITEKDRVEGEIPYYGASGVVDYVDGYIFDEELLLVSEDGANLLARSTPIAFSIKGKTWVNNHAHVLKFSNKLIQKYVELYLNSISLEPYVTGSAQPKLNQKRLNEIPIPLPELNIMSNIIEAISQINELIALRKEQLTKLDQLVKSRFIELFGDPMTNPMGWDKVNISAVVGGRVSNGFFAKREDYCADGNVKVLGVAHVVNCMYSNTEDLPTTNGSETDIVKYGVKYGDMLFCRSSLVAAGIGKASIVPKGTPNNVLFECHVIRLPLDLEKCVPEFMQVLSTTDYYRNQVIAQSKTATMTTIGQDGILKTDIILPPMEMQKKFLAFVEQTEKSKLAIQQSLEKLELLKKALMQEYFG